MASVRPQGKSWQVVWREGPHGGARKQRSRNFKRHADALAFARRMTQEVETRGIGDPSRMTLLDYLREYLSGLHPDDYSPKTLEGYQRCIDYLTRVPELERISLSRVTARDLTRAYARLRKDGNRRASKVNGPLSARSVHHAHRFLNVALEVARKHKLIAENPARDATAPTPEELQVTSFAPDEVVRMLADAVARTDDDPELHVIVATTLAGGLRRSELCGLAVDALVLYGDRPTMTIARVVVQVNGQPVVKVPKSTKSRRTLVLPPLVADLLRAQRARVQAAALAWGKGYRREPMYLFPAPGGGPRPPELVSQKFEHLMKRCGIDKPSPVHSWRHTAGTSLWEATKDVKAIQSQLGHSTPAITLKLYVHPSDEADQGAADHFERVLSGQPRKPR